MLTTRHTLAFSMRTHQNHGMNLAVTAVLLGAAALCFQAGCTTDFRAQDFGAKGDGVTDDGPAIQRAVSAALAAGKPARMVFEPGKTYRLLTPQATKASDAGLFELHGINDLTIDGGGSLFLLHPDVQFLQASNCQRLAVANLEIDFSPLPFVSGVITAVDKPVHAVDVEILPGFDLPATDGRPMPRHPPFFGWLEPAEANKQSARYHYFVEKITETEPGSLLRRRVRLFAQENTCKKFEGVGITVGTRISVPIPGAAHADRRLVSITDCADITLANWSVWSAPYFAFSLARNSGTLLVTNVTLAPKPGSGRMMASGRDGFHCKGNRGQMIFDGCTVSGLGDDSFNISSMTAGLHRQESGTTIVVRRVFWPSLDYPAFAPDDLLSFFDESGKGILFSARVAAMESFEEKSLKLTRLSFTNTLPMLPGKCLIYNMNIPAPGVIIRNSRITGSCRMRAPMLIEHSTFTGFNWYYGDDIEGPFPRRVMIRRSYFVNGDPNNNRGDALIFASPKFSATTRATEYEADDIVLENNVFDGAVVCDHCRNLAVIGNQFNYTNRFIATGLENALFRDNTFGGNEMIALPYSKKSPAALASNHVVVAGSSRGAATLSLMKPFTFFMGRLCGKGPTRHIAAVGNGASGKYAGAVAKFGKIVECYELIPPGHALPGAEVAIEEDIEQRFTQLAFLAAPQSDDTRYVVYAVDSMRVARREIASGALPANQWTEVVIDLAAAAPGPDGYRRINISLPGASGAASPVFVGGITVSESGKAALGFPRFGEAKAQVSQPLEAGAARQP